MFEYLIRILKSISQRRVANKLKIQLEVDRIKEFNSNPTLDNENFYTTIKDGVITYHRKRKL